MIYFIQIGKRGPLKIGWAKNPRTRLQQLQISHPRKLRIVSTFDLSREHERILHHALVNHRIRGEWYKNSPSVIESSLTGRVPETELTTASKFEQRIAAQGNLANAAYKLKLSSGYVNSIAQGVRAPTSSIAKVIEKEFSIPLSDWPKLID